MNITTFITSGILEGYILDTISKEDRITVEKMVLTHKEIRIELSLIEKSLEVYSSEHAINPPTNLKSKILAEIESQELIGDAPILHISSKIADYQPWINMIKPPTEFDNVHMEVIGDYENAKMVIAWIRTGESIHLHTEYTENFLIVEGSCTATIDGKTADYGVGDYVSFPINKNHGYEVTSNIPMTVIACLDLKAA